MVGSLRMSRPSVSLGIRKTDSPLCLGASGSVRVSMARIALSAAAPEHHSFCPLTTQPLPSRRARVFVDAASDPAPGSEIEIEKRMSPSRKGWMYRSFCSGVPNFSTFIAVNVATINPVEKSKPYLANPSHIRA